MAHEKCACPVDEFHSEWARHARVVESARDWLQWDDIQAAIEIAARKDEPAGSLALLEQLQLTVSEWQSARRELGAHPYWFEATQRCYDMARSAVVGHLMAWFAYLVVPRASGAHGPTVPPELEEVALAWIGQLRESKVPDDVVELPLESSVVTRRVASDALKLARDIPAIGELPSFVEPLRELSIAAPAGVGALKDEPDKAATNYEINDEATREQHAMAAVEAVLKIADALALKCGESLDSEAARRHPLVTLLSHGPWANRVAVLAAVRYALEKSVPRTAARMKDRQAFRDVDDLRTLWAKFEELGEIPKPVAPTPAKPKFEVAGTGWTEDELATSAAQGPCGELVQRLEGCANPTLDLGVLRESDREKLAVGGKRGGSSGGGGSASRWRPPEALLKMLGAAGEHFVFQQLRRLVSDFDLTGNASVPRCFIEVKSTAHDGADAFEMTTNEWETAIRCHAGAEQAVYLIICVSRTATRPEIQDMFVDPVQLHLDGFLDYSSRALLVAVGKRRQPDRGTISA